jgi:chromosome partitioning protein
MKIIALANQKGGVAKTSSTYNLAAAKAMAGAKTLMVDLDPQASLTISCGIEPGDKSLHDHSTCDLFNKKADPNESVFPVAASGLDNLYIVPSDILLAETEISLNAMRNAAVKLKVALGKLTGNYDYIFVDCPPQLGILTTNALTAANQVIVPVKTDYLSFRGLGSILDTIDEIKDGDGPDSLNPNLEFLGTIATFFESNVKDQQEILKALQAQTPVLGIIKKSADVPRKVTEGLPVVLAAKSKPVAKEYIKIAMTL